MILIALNHEVHSVCNEYGMNETHDNRMEHNQGFL